MSETTFGLRRLGQVLVPVEDLARAITFYRDVLGVAFLFEVPRMAFFDLGSVRLMLAEHEGKGSGAVSILYYAVDDIRQAHATLAERGVAFDQGPSLIAEMEDHDLWMAFFRDSEGNPLALMAEERGY
jgi:predicted enzyme related to lactoylglutathione lyase